MKGIKIQQTGYTLYLQIPDNHLECRCSYDPLGQGAALTTDKLADTLNKHGVVEMIDQHACENFVEGHTLPWVALRPAGSALRQHGVPTCLSALFIIMLKS